MRTAIRRSLARICIIFFVVLSACSDDQPDPVNNGNDPIVEPVGSIPKVIDPDINIMMRGTKISQIVGDYDRERDQPTQNQTYTRYQLRATDLGVPFYDGERTWILFGDTWGAAGGDRDALAFTTDSDPEDGLSLDFITDDGGTYQPVNIPGVSQGAFEVPMEGISLNGSMYVYHTTDNSPQVRMGRSLVARSIDGGKTFINLYDLSTNKFINVSVVKVSRSDWSQLPAEVPEAGEEGLVIFGSGTYRMSNVYLAYQPAPEIEDPETIRYFAGLDNNGEPYWNIREEDAMPVFNLSAKCVGELSVSFNKYIKRWIMLYNCNNPRGINMRTAEYPWGPWTESQIVFHPWDDNGYCHFIHANWENLKCDSVHDTARENIWGGEYGPYQFEYFASGDSLSTTIYFTLSTWNPYTVVLMKAILEK